MANLRKKELWADQAEALETGESLVASARRCGVAVTTAFRWRHRFLAASTRDKPEKLTGIVEADETFILESFKGRRSGLPRPARERGGKAAKRGLSAEQIPVLVARDRSGATTDAILPKLSRAAVTKALGGVVTSANQLLVVVLASASIPFITRAKNTWQGPSFACNPASVSSSAKRPFT